MQDIMLLWQQSDYTMCHKAVEDILRHVNEVKAYTNLFSVALHRATCHNVH